MADFALVLAFFGVALLIALTASPRLQLSSLNWLNVLQLRIPGSPLSSQSLFALAVLPRSLRSLRGAPAVPALLILCAIIPIQVISIIFSPDRAFGLRRVSALLVLIALSALVLSSVRERKDPLLIVLTSGAPLIILESISTVAFRLNPSLERSYLRSAFARVFFGDAASDIFTIAPNNVLYTFKAGGLFFLNGNQASLFLGVALLSSLMLFVQGRQKRWLLLSLSACAGIVASGSKTGIILMIILPLSAWLIWLVSRARARAFWVPIVLISGALLSSMIWDALPSLSSGRDLLTGRVDDATETFGTRLRIWEVAAGLFADSPFFGVGFGGWDEAFGLHPLGRSFTRIFPPHNLVVNAWAEAGFFNALLLVLFFLVCLVGGLRVCFDSGGARLDRIRGLFGAFVMLWVFVHGFADNTDLWGTPHCAAFVAVAVVFCSRTSATLRIACSEASASTTTRRRRAAL